MLGFHCLHQLCAPFPLLQIDPLFILYESNMAVNMTCLALDTTWYRAYCY